jgi:predicted SprT family Zn-dependent metalloprotease
MQAESKGSVIKMHVVIGQEGMQQGLAFNPSVLLLKTFLIFNGSVLHELIIHYAPHNDIQAYNTNN